MYQYTKRYTNSDYTIGKTHTNTHKDKKEGERMGDVINIAQLKKVNNLANTLNQHGLAVNRQEAANLARDINGGNEMDYLNGLNINEKQEMEVVHTSNGQQMVMEQKKSTSDFMTKNQVECILQKFCDLFGEEMNQLNAQIKGLEIKFNYLQEQLLEAAKAPKSEPTVQQPQQSPQTTFNREPENNPSLGAEQQTAQQPSPSDDGNHKTGGYDSTDVSVEKFFYFGTKN
jgi:hypothetical protein